MRRRAIALAVAALATVAGCTGAPPGQQTTSEPPQPPGQEQAQDRTLPDGIATAPQGAAFYQAPAATAATKAGELIWARPLNSPIGSEGFGLMYWSTAMDGALVPVSAVLFRPAGPASTQPRSIVAWAHGTFGLGDQCAPSQGYFQGSGASLPVVDAAMKEGLVFVASDYQGLGTPGPHPFMVSQSAARNVLDSIRAAARFTAAGADVGSVVVGQSQGGAAALLAAEVQPDYAPDVRLRAAVAISAPSRLDLLDGQLSGGSYFGYVLMAIHGFESAYPQLADEAQTLAEPGRTALRTIGDRCASQILDEFSNRTETEFGTATVLDTPEFTQLLTQHDPGRVVTPVPIMIVHGEEDDTIPVSNSRDLARRYCALGVNLTAKYYLGKGHLDVFGASLQDVVPYVRNRLAGTPAMPSCRS